MEWISSWWEGLPEPLQDPVALAVPVFVVVLLLEALAAALLEEHPGAGDTAEADRPRRGAYLRADAYASIAQGVVSIGTSAVWKALGLLVYAGIWAYLAPWQLSADSVWTWVLALLGVDFLFYWEHRVAHRVRLVWATHQAHHSSEYFNFSTAVRQKWNASNELLMWLPLPFLGVPPWVIFVSYSVNLVYQFFVHTERVDRLWRPIELVLNTPSHHRVHHGRDPEYLDKNYAGVLIVWDRLFGSFQEELARPHYGLTTPVGTYNILKLQTHEYAAIARDVRAAGTWRDKLGYVFGPPGWRPTPEPRIDPGAEPTPA